MEIPFSYKDQNIYNSIVDPGIKYSNTAVYEYFRKYLLQEIFSVYKITLPDDLKWWDKSYLLHYLFVRGYIGVFDVDKYGLLCQRGSLGGLNVFERPTEFTPDNLLLKAKRYKIGEECAVIKLQPNYGSIVDIVDYYANLLSLAYEGLTVDIFNGKMGLIFGTDSKNHAESIKKMFDNVGSGEPAVVIDKALFNEKGELSVTVLPSAVKYGANEKLITIKQIIQMFNTDIGIPNTNTEKKAQQTDDEIRANDVETYTKAQLWLESMQEGFSEVKRLFGKEITVEFRNKPVFPGNVEGFEDESDDEYYRPV